MSTDQRTTRGTGRGVEQRWQGLNAAQADGTECVMCETSFLWPILPAGQVPDPRPRTRRGPNGTASVPVGRSHTGSQVFACAGICAALAFPD